jgi:hypothetical protein
MTTRSGSGSSNREETQAGSFILDIENLWCHIFEDPNIQGSRRMVKSSADWVAEGRNGRMGRKLRRKEASEFRCLTVKDIFEAIDNSIEKSLGRHSRMDLGAFLFFEVG